MQYFDENDPDVLIRTSSINDFYLTITVKRDPNALWFKTFSVMFLCFNNIESAKVKKKIQKNWKIRFHTIVNKKQIFISLLEKKYTMSKRVGHIDWIVYSKFTPRFSLLYPLVPYSREACFSIFSSTFQLIIPCILIEEILLNQAINGKKCFTHFRHIQY